MISIFRVALLSRGASLWLAVALTAAAVGCGDDDDDSTPIAGSGGAAGSRTAGSGGRAGALGGAGTTGVVVAEPVACGSSQCQPPNSLLSGLAGIASLIGITLPSAVPCCLDSADGSCGTAASADATCEAPAIADARCPGLSFGAIPGLPTGAAPGANMGGCCIANQCGLDGSLFGRGCLESSEAQTLLNGIAGLGGFLTFPPALACDRPIEVDDAGVSADAGL